MTTRKKIRFTSPISPDDKPTLEYLAHEDAEGQTWKPLTEAHIAKFSFGDIGEPVPVPGVKIHSLEIPKKNKNGS